MTSKSKFYYPITLHKDANAYPVLAPWLTALPLVRAVTDEVVVLEESVGRQQQGLYAFDGARWHFAMPMPDISASIIFGDTLDIYINKTLDVTLPVSARVYKNGQLQGTNDVVHGMAVYAARLASSSSGGAGVISLNGLQGMVTITAGAGIAISALGSNITITSTGDDEGTYQ